MASLLVLVAAILLAPHAPAQAQRQMRLSFNETYIPDFPIKRKMNGRYRPALNVLRAELLNRNRKGEDLHCSTQILREVHWMINYTARKEDVKRRTAEMAESLKQPDQAFARRQDPEDGSWGACHEEWFWRLHASIDPFKELAVRGERPTHPLKFLEPVDTPEELKAVLQDLLVSKVESGHNKRKELNVVFTALGQFYLLPELADMFPPEFPRDELGKALVDFIDNDWHDPETGYWGAWYEEEGEIHKTEDLSVTYHILAYRPTPARYLKQMADTTFAIRNQHYPYGWQDRGRQNNHHAYDVVRMLERAWEHMTPEQQARASAEIWLLLVRSLALSVDHKGAFISRPYDSLAEAYYFGVSFLDEVGLFDESRRFWTTTEFINAEPIRQRIEEHLLALNSNAPMAQSALRKLRAWPRQ